MLGYRVSFAADDPLLDAYLARLYAAFPRAEHADHEYAVCPKDDGRFELLVDGSPAGEVERPEFLVSTLVNHLNRQAAAEAEHVLVHAGGVEADGVAIVLPAHMESGKTTLTTGLVRVGFRYLTDEAVAIDRATRTIVPYPKPMSLDPGSWALFPELEPDEPFASDGYKETQWQIPPGAIRPDALGGPCRARFVVFPKYEEGARTELVPLSRAEALVEIAKNTFRFNAEGRPTLAVLAEVIRETEVYRLPNGSLDEAVACINRLVNG